MKQLAHYAVIVFLIISNTSFAKQSSLNFQKSTKEMSQEALLVELTGKDLSKESDMTLYAEMVRAYQGEDEIGLKSHLQSLVSRFPQSSYADNALYLVGRLAADRNNYSEAIKYFSQIEKQYPRSNRIVAAKFAKAMMYKKMNLPEFAKQSLQQLKADFPGSPESFRASAELKLLK